MATCSVCNVRLAGISVAIPEHFRSRAEDEEDFGKEIVAKIQQHSGVTRRPVSLNGLCASDLCFVAAERLLENLNWPRESVDALIFVTQTPDYLLPATSCVLQQRLSLAKRCAAFDVNLGCSGYVYGLWLAGQVLASAGMGRALLLVGDTISRIVSPMDRASAMLFGDAGSATALERTDDASPMLFELGSDGRGRDHLIVPAGSFRRPRTDLTQRRTEREGGAVRSDEDLFMDGAEVFSFAIREVTPLIKSVLAQADWPKESLDGLVLHQANEFILQHLAKRLGMPREKVPSTLENYGNTSSASIPLTMVVSLGERLKANAQRLVLAGFGVGWSWGAVALSCGPMSIEGPLVARDEIIGTPEESSRD
jgi:3-oxoacyl-[acyl-carrier-protein] synthase III